MISRRSQTRSIRGVAAVEFGLLLVPLVLITFGITEYGRAIYTYNTLDKAARDAVRHLSAGGPGDATRQAEASCLVRYGNTGCTGTTLAPGLTSANVSICDAVACAGTHDNQPTTAGTIDLMTVTIQNYAYDSVMEFVMPDLNFNNISVTMRSQ